MNLKEMLGHYIAHQEEVVTRRTEFDLNFAKDRMHIVEGLIKAISILDEVIKTIRQSKNKADAKVNLQDKYGFTERQAEYIVTLQLYRLTNSDIEELNAEYENLKKVIQGLQEILDDLLIMLKDEVNVMENAIKQYNEKGYQKKIGALE